MRTITDEPKVLIEYDENHAIVIGFPTNETTLKAGQSVKLDADGAVSKITATTQRPLGMIVSAWTATDKGNVRVLTPYSAILSNAVSVGVTDEGALLAYAGETVDGLPKYKTAAAGDYVSAQVIRGGADAASIQVGIFRVGAYKVV